MTVLCCCGDELLLARANSDESSVVPMGDDEACNCQWYWLVNSFSFASELFENAQQRRIDKKNQRSAVVMRKRLAADGSAEITDNE